MPTARASRSPSDHRRSLPGATRAILALLAGLVAAGVFVALRPSDDGPSAPRLRPGDAPPDFVLPDLRDPRRVRASSDLFGTPSVVTFLASTCVPCRTELPILQALADRYAGRVAVLGIAHLEFRERALPFIEELGISFPVAHDEAGGTAVGWFVPSLPATFFLDREGRVVKAAVGPATREELESGVEAILR